VTTKDCPFCLSTVLLKATRCAHCTSEFPRNVEPRNGSVRRVSTHGNGARCNSGFEPLMGSAPGRDYIAFGLERKADSPDLLETLVVRSNGRNCWSRVVCAQGRRATSRFRVKGHASCPSEVSARHPRRESWCPYQNLSWSATSEVSGTPCPLRPGSNLGRGVPSTGTRFHTANERKTRCILTRALGSLCRSGSFARVKMMQAADLWDLDHLAKRANARQVSRQAHLAERRVRSA
jgi:hypothetical protein